MHTGEKGEGLWLRHMGASALAVMGLAALAAPAQAATRYVGLGEAYDSIQDAIDASAPGDEVVVAPGNYPERLTIATAVKIRAQSVILEGDEQSAGQYIVTVTSQADGAQILGLTIDGGFTSGGMDVQAAIEVQGLQTQHTRDLPALNVARSLRGKDITLDDGSTSDASFASLLTVGQGAVVEIDTCSFSRGGAGASSLATAVLNDGGTLRLQQCTLTQSGDSAASPTALRPALLQRSGDLSMVSSRFDTNAAPSVCLNAPACHGRDLRVESGTAYVSRSVFTFGNGLHNDGASVWVLGGDLEVWDSKFAKNSAIETGGAGTLWLVRNDFCGATTSQLNAQNNGTQVLLNNLFFGAEGIVPVRGSALDLYHNHFYAPSGSATPAVGLAPVVAIGNVFDGFSTPPLPATSELTAGEVVAFDNAVQPSLVASADEPENADTLTAFPAFVFGPEDSDGCKGPPAADGYSPMINEAMRAVDVDVQWPQKLLFTGQGTDPDGSVPDIGVFGGPAGWYDEGEFQDTDLDGWVDLYDCAPEDPAIHPYASDLCGNTVDEDCDGSVDEGFHIYDDLDGDGFGVTDASGLTCFVTATTANRGGDCDDREPLVYPGAQDFCDGVDSNCNNVDDYAITTWGRDEDGDGWGSPDSTVDSCAAPDGYAPNTDDCDDALGGDLGRQVFVWYPDTDGDGYGGDSFSAVAGCDPPEPTGFVSQPGDCDEGSSSVNPGQLDDSCDGTDNDCDGAVDEAAGTPIPLYVDNDFDGYGAGPSVGTTCGLPSDKDGLTTLAGDCDDNDTYRSPDHPEVCNGIDNDCDLDVDDGVSVTVYTDSDGDGFGTGSGSQGCVSPTTSATAGDCDDADAAVYPGADELCDGIDSDCFDVPSQSILFPIGTGNPSRSVPGAGTGIIPERRLFVGGLSVYLYEPATGPVRAEVVRMSDEARLLDVTFPATSVGWLGVDGLSLVLEPGEEVAIVFSTESNGLSIDDIINPGDLPDFLEVTGRYIPSPGGTPTSLFASRGVRIQLNLMGEEDADVDGVRECEFDCNDGNELVYPGQTETCNGLDEDCDGVLDEDPSSGGVTWYANVDGDAFVDVDTTAVFCASADPAGWDKVLTEDDCDDNDPLVGEGATWYRDGDGDGYAPDIDPMVQQACADPGFAWVDVQGDCDDSESNVSPVGIEVCDEIDNDCDDTIDEGQQGVWYPDLDDDGYTDNDASVLACSAPGPNYTLTASGIEDCDDLNPERSPGLEEVCDKVDNDCNFVVDNGVEVVVYIDGDEDTWGDEAIVGCLGIDGVGRQGDCNDGDETIYDGAPEICGDGIDQDCDLADLSCSVTDTDGDGYCEQDCEDGSLPGDCDDDDITSFPGADELCDGVDNDCDGLIDDNPAAGGGVVYYRDVDGDGFTVGSVTEVFCPGSSPEGWTPVQNAEDCDDNNGAIGAAETWYFDGDGDGFAPDTAPQTTLACSAPSADWVQQQGDCDDTKILTFTGATELCDAEDNDCDSATDEGVTTTFYPDLDRDGHYDPEGAIEACDPPADYAETSTLLDDCDDDNPDRYLGLAEVCDGVDNDCDQVVDDGVQQVVYVDGDEDGFGGDPIVGCLGIDGIATSGDCADGDGSRYPGAPDPCGDGIDQDCDGNDFACSTTDTDGDGYCPANCTDGSLPGDCNDGDRFTYPGAPEACDGINNDCDQLTDEEPDVGGVDYYADVDGDDFTDNDVIKAFCAGATPENWLPTQTVDDCDDLDALAGAPLTWLLDGDADGFAPDGGTTTTACIDPGVAWVTVAGDCNDADGDSYPGAVETCDEADNDCDETTDEGVTTTFYPDGDGDQHYAPDAGVEACSAPDATYSESPALLDDCDDSEATVFLGADEVCDGLDNDCDEGTDEGVQVALFADGDGDGFGDAPVTGCLGLDGVEVAGDCDDGDGSVFPGAEEVCGDGVDQDCVDGDVSCDADDSDGDGFCPADCTDGSAPGDCDDADPTINPYAPDVCDGVDNDCDDEVDERLSADADGDGFTALGSCEGTADDCNDWLAGVYPGAEEICDGLDQDCDGLVDEGLVVDEDEDGFPAEGACAGLVALDCDDTDPDVNPDATELPGNGVDEDCDGQEDEEEGAYDDDGDGYCEGSSCADGSLTGDCDDTDPAISPAQPVDVPEDGLDNDCDGSVDEGGDADRDGDGFTTAQGDCNDLDDAVYPGAEEVCDGYDTNCDGFVGPEELDIDGDGLSECEGDCNDFDDEIRPGLAEDCADAKDNNCNGIVNEDADADGDTYTTCEGDCNDADASVNPGQDEESCNRIDDNCNGLVDEGLDRDGDGWIACELQDDCAPALSACDCDDFNRLVAPDLPEICGDGLDNNCDGLIDNDEDRDLDGWSTCEGDCNDADPFVSPATPESCDGKDNDCDRQIDETFDWDEDGWLTCRGDCDDTEMAVNPLELEACDLLDNDCNGVVDDDWPDVDGDLYTECTELVDCAEGDATRNPEATEDCSNGVDDDCDGDIDVADAECEIPEETPAYPPYWYCGCASTGSTSGGMWMLFGLAAAMRRRRRS